MTLAPAPETRPPLLSTRVLFFGEEDQGASHVRSALSKHDLIGHPGLGPLAGRAAAKAVAAQVTSIGQRLVDLDAGEALVNVWRAHRDLIEAAQQTLLEPGSRTTVVLADHDVLIDHEPAVEVLVEDVHLTTITFKMALDLSVESLVVVVEHGTLIEIAHGDVHVTGILSLYGNEVLKKSRSLPLPNWFRLRGHLTLVESDPARQRRDRLTQGNRVPAPHRRPAGTPPVAEAQPSSQQAAAHVTAQVADDQAAGIDGF